LYFKLIWIISRLVEFQKAALGEMLGDIRGPEGKPDPSPFPSPPLSGERAGVRGIFPQLRDEKGDYR